MCVDSILTLSSIVKFHNQELNNGHGSSTPDFEAFAAAAAVVLPRMSEALAARRGALCPTAHSAILKVVTKVKSARASFAGFMPPGRLAELDCSRLEAKLIAVSLGCGVEVTSAAEVLLALATEPHRTG